MLVQELGNHGGMIVVTTGWTMINYIVIGCIVTTFMITLDSWLDEEVGMFEKAWWAFTIVVVAFYAVYAFATEGIL